MINEMSNNKARLDSYVEKVVEEVGVKSRRDMRRRMEPDCIRSRRNAIKVLLPVPSINAFPLKDNTIPTSIHATRTIIFFSSVQPYKRKIIKCSASQQACARKIHSPSIERKIGNRTRIACKRGSSREKQ
jgi:hypothetical protein